MRKRRDNKPHSKWLSHYDIAYPLALALFEGNPFDTDDWFETKNEICFGQTPLEAIASGGGIAVINWLKQRAGQKPGSAF